MTELIPWLIGVVAVAAVVAALALIWRRGRGQVAEDSYTRGLELWLAGDLKGAIASMRDAIDERPDGIDSYHQLGNLLRETGDAGRAVALHRALTVRRDIGAPRRVSIALALIDDLLALGRWNEAGEVLDEVGPMAKDSPRYWRGRFRQLLGLGDEKAAALSLKSAARHCDGDDRRQARRDLGIFQLDRALDYARDGDYGLCRKLLKDVPDDTDDGAGFTARKLYVRSFASHASGDADEAVRLASEGLLAHPESMWLLLPVLRNALLECGRFERTIPILERACQAETAPAALWISLALLYEKTGEREHALRLLRGKAGDPGLTPDVAAPFLKILAADDRESDFGRVWACLVPPAAATARQCRVCGHTTDDVRWFCRQCTSFDSYDAARGGGQP